MAASRTACDSMCQVLCIFLCQKRLAPAFSPSAAQRCSSFSSRLIPNRPSCTQACVRDSISPATALGLQYRRRGSCHTPVFTWRPSIPSRRSSSVERTAGQCHRRTIFVLIPATRPEDISFPATCDGVNNTNYCDVVLKCLALSTTLILAN